MRWKEDEENTQKKKENKVLWQGSNYFLQKTKKNLFNVCKKTKKKWNWKNKKHKYEYEEILKTRETQNQNSF